MALLVEPVDLVRPVAGIIVVEVSILTHRARV